MAAPSHRGVISAIRLWDAGSGAHITAPLRGIRIMSLASRSVPMAAPSHRGVGGITQCVLWDVGSGAPIGAPLRGIQTLWWQSSLLTFSPDGRTLATGELSMAIWVFGKWGVMSEIYYKAHLDARHTGVRSVAFSPDGKYLARSHRGRWVNSSASVGCGE